MRKFSAPELRQIIILYSQLKKNRRKGGDVLVEKEDGYEKQSCGDPILTPETV